MWSKEWQRLLLEMGILWSRRWPLRMWRMCWLQTRWYHRYVFKHLLILWLRVIIPFFDYTVNTIFLTFLYNSFDKLWRKSKIWPKMWSRRICFRWWLAIGMWWIIRKPMLLKMGILWSWCRSLCLWRMCRLQIKRPNRFNNFP